MKNYAFPLVLILSLVMIPAGANAATFTVVAGTCPAGMVCILSMNSTSNTHVAECGYYGLSLCMTNADSSAVRTGSCNSGEAAFLRLYQLNNSHAATVESGIYDNVVCLSGTRSFEVATRNVCHSTETCALSINASSNAHVGACGYYGNQICVRELSSVYTFVGRVFDSITGAILNLGNATAIVRETGDKGYGVITGGTFTLDLNVSSFDPTTRRYTVGVRVNDTSGKSGAYQLIVGSGPPPSTQQSCTTNLWHFNGTVSELSTAQDVTSGTVTISVRDTEYGNSTSFSSRVWDIYLRPCLVSGELYTFDIAISSGSAVGRTSIQQIAK